VVKVNAVVFLVKHFMPHRTHCIRCGLLLRRSSVITYRSVSVTLLVMFIFPAKTAEAIEMLFGGPTQVGPRNHVLDWRPDRPKGRGNFGGCPPHSKALGDFAAVYAKRGD